EAEVEEVEEGLYQVTLRDPRTGRPFLVVILAYSPGWVSPVTYMGHGVLDEELLRSLYPRIVERLRSSSSSR
ncbi:MAG: hypothetical protein GXO15_05680, partial [Crenarchaeota archaeon]|nr:hypothetical protein [Thermoproteota archaeon]